MHRRVGRARGLIVCGHVSTAIPVWWTRPSRCGAVLQRLPRCPSQRKAVRLRAYVVERVHAVEERYGRDGRRARRVPPHIGLRRAHVRCLVAIRKPNADASCPKSRALARGDACRGADSWTGGAGRFGRWREVRRPSSTLRRYMQRGSRSFGREVGGRGSGVKY
jgi:hypothetical protein